MFSFGGLLFVVCVGVCRCGDVWGFVWWGNVGKCGESRDGQVVFGLGCRE